MVPKAISIVNNGLSFSLKDLPYIAMTHYHQLILQIQSLVIIEIILDIEIIFFYLILIIQLIYNPNSFWLGFEICSQTSAKD